MNCKNCETELPSIHKYCTQCGAQVVNERITLKSLISGLLVSLGWDNQFFVTFRDLVLKPHLVIERYLNGTRKKYTNPFTFFAFGAALSVLIIGFYSDKLVQLSSQVSTKTTELLIDSQLKGEKSAVMPDAIEKQEAINKKLYGFMFKHYYYLSFLLLPLYAFIAFLIYGKPNNYGEHLVINAYIHGLLFFLGLLLIFLTLLIHQEIYSSGSILLTVIYYLYVYKKYRKHTIGKTIKVLLKFLLISLVILLIIVAIGFLIGMLTAH